MNRTETTYRNPWHRADERMYGEPTYRTSVKPTMYRGYAIYHRIAFDVVKNGCCVGQYAGLSGAKRFIDLILDGNEEDAGFWRQRVASYFA